MAIRAGGRPADAMTSWRLARRSLGHRRRQTLLIILVSGLISGTAVFAAGYQHQVQQAVLDATFAVDGPGNAWSLAAGPGVDLPALLPSGAERLTEPPVAGRYAAVQWHNERSGGPELVGGLRWRADIGAHLVLVSGRCPANRATSLSRRPTSVTSTFRSATR